MDRLIIVVYFGVGNIPSSDIPDIVKRWSDILRSDLRPSDLLWVIPRRDTSTVEIEVINKPILVTDEEYKTKIENQIDKIEKALNDRVENKETE